MPSKPHTRRCIAPIARGSGKHRLLAVSAALGASLASELALLSPAEAQGGPPLITEDPGTPGDGNWETNVAVTLEQTRKEREFAAPELDINYGYGDNVQLKLELPWVVIDDRGGHARSGLGNVELGVKWRFLEGASGLAMSVYPQLAFSPGSSSKDRGLVDGNELILPVQAATPFGPLNVTSEVGHTLVESDEDEWIYGVAVGYPATPRLELLAELNGAATRDLDEDTLVFNLGGAYRLNQRLYGLASAGRSFRESGSGEPELLGYLGLQFLY